MRTLLTLSLGCICVVASHAAILTVNNSSKSPGQFTTISAAIAAANDGDTIYVHGSLMSYAESPYIYVNKSVHIIGPGYRPNKDNPIIANLGEVKVAISSPTHHYVYLSGLKISSLNNFATFGDTDSLYVERCQIQVVSLTKYNKYQVFRNNLIGTIEQLLGAYSPTYSCFVQNNIIYDLANFHLRLSHVLFDHNIVKGDSTLIPFMNQWDKSGVSNNIFLNVEPTTFDTCDVINNLIYSWQADSFPSSVPGSIFANNINNQLPLFESALNTAGYSVMQDYRLKPASPAIGTGTGSSDMGIYDGMYPFPEGGNPASSYFTSAEPQLPQVHKMQVITPSVPKGTPITISVTGESQE